MSSPTHSSDKPVRTLDQLVAILAAGERPRDDWRIGTECEMFPIHRGSLSPARYEAQGIRGVLSAFVDRGWEPVLDRGELVGAKLGGRNLSLEAGGQFEHSGAPCRDLHEVRREMDSYVRDLLEIGEMLDLGFLPLGYAPLCRVEEAPWMPRERYDVIGAYLRAAGTLGHHMLQQTCTAQTNLDYRSEEDMRRKFRLALRMQPLATALFANSPFVLGGLSGHRSYRAHIWSDVDPSRTGIPAIVFDDSFGYREFVSWALDVPMSFVRRGDRYFDARVTRFGDYVAKTRGGHHLVERFGPATESDFRDHLSSIYTDVRLKGYLEMRGADVGPPDMILAQAAFWTGILYDQAAMEVAEEMFRDQSWRETVELRSQVPTRGLDASAGNGSLRDLALGVVALASAGLAGRKKLDGRRSEADYVQPLFEIAASGVSQADRLVAAFARYPKRPAHLLVEEHLLSSHCAAHDLSRERLDGATVAPEVTAVGAG